MVGLDILTEKQFAEMAKFAESKLSVVAKEHNVSLQTIANYNYLQFSYFYSLLMLYSNVLYRIGRYWFFVKSSI